MLIIKKLKRETESYIIQIIIFIQGSGKKVKKRDKVNLYIKMVMNLMVYLERIKNIVEMDIYIMIMEIYIMDI